MTPLPAVPCCRMRSHLRVPQSLVVPSLIMTAITTLYEYLWRRESSAMVPPMRPKTVKELAFPRFSTEARGGIIQNIGDPDEGHSFLARVPSLSRSHSQAACVGRDMT